MQEKIVEVKNLSLSYKNIKAINDVTFSVEPGEIVAIIGSNGSGKTSTVECIEGLKTPDSGKIEVFGLNPLLSRTKLYKKMGVQLQETTFPPRIKVDELCALFASFYENPADWNTLLRELNLEGKRKRFVNKLSGGEKQRLSILLSLMGRPRLLILDELTTGLDPEVRVNMWSSIKDIRTNGISVIMVSHYLDEVEALSDKILYLEKGNQKFFGTQEAFRQYARSQISTDKWNEKDSLEKIYLLLSPKTNGISMEGIL